MMLDMTSPYGWLAPSGEFFGCQKDDLETVMQGILGFDTEASAIVAGYAKVYESKNEFGRTSPFLYDYVGNTKKLTLAQKQWLYSHAIRLHDDEEKNMRNFSKAADLDAYSKTVAQVEDLDEDNFRINNNADFETVEEEQMEDVYVPTVITGFFDD